jgi:hypothetical protein
MRWTAGVSQIISSHVLAQTVNNDLQAKDFPEPDRYGASNHPSPFSQ